MPSPSAPAPALRRAAPRRSGAALAALLLTFLACTPPGAAPAGDAEGAAGTEAAARLHVIATLSPLAWLVEGVGGDRVTVEVLIPTGATPHTFEPSPRRVAELARADLLVTVGHPHLVFEQRMVDRLAGEAPGAATVAILDDGAGGGSRGGLDPHVWLDPLTARAGAARIADTLASLDAANAASYGEGRAAVAAALTAVHREASILLEPHHDEPIFVDHPAWGHLLARYGLRQVALEEEGKEPTPRRLVEMAEAMRQSGARTLFVQRGVAHRAAHNLAQEVGAELVELDPLARDLPGTLHRAVRAMAAELEGRAQGDGGDGGGAS